MEMALTASLQNLIPLDQMQNDMAPGGSTMGILTLLQNMGLSGAVGILQGAWGSVLPPLWCYCL